MKREAKDLFDNRLGWSDRRNPYAPREFWYRLGIALYGKDDPRVVDLLPNELNQKTEGEN